MQIYFREPLLKAIVNYIKCQTIDHLVFVDDIFILAFDNLSPTPRQTVTYFNRMQ